jgi:hypothetical protein
VFNIYESTKRNKYQLQVSTSGEFPRSDDDSLISFCPEGEGLVIIARRRPASPPPLVTQPTVTVEDINAVMAQHAFPSDQEGGEGEDSVRVNGPRQYQPEAEAVENSLRALVAGNFEQLRGYLEQLQEAVARTGLSSDGEIVFSAQAALQPQPEDEHDEEDDEDDEDEDEDEDEEDEEDEDHDHDSLVLNDPLNDMLTQRLGLVATVNADALGEMQAMGFPEQLSRNALLLHRNRLENAVDWALNHADDAHAEETLPIELLAALYLNDAPQEDFLRDGQRLGASHSGEGEANEGERNDEHQSADTQTTTDV